MLRTVGKKSVKLDQLGRIACFPSPCKGNTSQPAAMRRVSPYVAPKGAKEKLAILPDIKIPMLMYV
ncbi:MAG: hypothetical protein LBK82_00210 [Planctomycetaceae bacterium]|jgi:hypothetical protein|nr:hypothetical protein [Planctomycetaceae bacterium]